MNGFCRTAALLVATIGLTAPARAETVAAKWDAYFYAAPRTDARVLDEVQRETRLDVRSCEASWCRVRYGEADGYVREDVVHGPGNEVRPAGGPIDETCFQATQPGGGRWQTERFCRAGP